MKKILLFAVLAMIGCVNSPDQSPIYLSAEIKEGNSWRYIYEYFQTMQTTIYSDISIDSIWGSSLDTLFFTVTRIDSILQKRSTDDSLLDSSIVVTPDILCKKAGIKTICSDDLISSIFSDKEYIQYNDGKGNYGNLINIQFGDRNFKTVDVASIKIIGASKSEENHFLFADTIGIICDTIAQGGHGIMPYIASTNLLKFNGRDFSYTTTLSPE